MLRFHVLLMPFCYAAFPCGSLLAYAAHVWKLHLFGVGFAVGVACVTTLVYVEARSCYAGVVA